MPDEIETILRLVAEGKLSPEEAEPIIAALGQRFEEDWPQTRATRHGDRQSSREQRHADRSNRRVERAFARAEERVAEATAGTRGRQLRIRVTERGRQVVNLRIPVAFAEAALRFVPGLGGDQTDQIREAVHSGATGPILDVEDTDGDGVLISVE
jgi:hypothetical protein